MDSHEHASRSSGASGEDADTEWKKILRVIGWLINSIKERDGTRWRAARAVTRETYVEITRQGVRTKSFETLHRKKRWNYHQVLAPNVDLISHYDYNPAKARPGAAEPTRTVLPEYPNLFFQKQPVGSGLCGLCAINNVIQSAALTSEAMDESRDCMRSMSATLYGTTRVPTAGTVSACCAEQRARKTCTWRKRRHLISSIRGLR